MQYRAFCPCIKRTGKSLLPSQGTRREIGVSQPEIGAALRPSAAYALVMSDSPKANSMNFNRRKNV